MGTYTNITQLLVRDSKKKTHTKFRIKTPRFTANQTKCKLPIKQYRRRAASTVRQKPHTARRQIRHPALCTIRQFVDEHFPQGRNDDATIRVLFVDQGTGSPPLFIDAYVDRKRPRLESFTSVPAASMMLRALLKTR